MDPLVDQVVQVTGALLILGAFVLAQLRVVEQYAYSYLVPNVVGSAALCMDALLTAQWGFVLLEGVWALVSAGSIVLRLARRR
ncbi:MAG TPA: hypothetical protein VFD49_13360 [Candidatus Dormibacteraeota bacterium]|nr:hypothetical protein [Candidatus Dormibacteraeota bacterium]